MNGNTTNEFENFRTPPKSEFTKSVFSIPPTPFLNCLGVGTGVNVWSLNNPAASPWAVKNVRKAMANSCYERYQSMIDREASVLADISHENIIGFRGFLKSDDGRHCLAMESGGKSLGNMIEERDEANHASFSPTQILKVVLDVAKALNYLHTEKNLLHGDIKSYNILIKGDFDEVKLCDLGVSVYLNNQGFAESYTGTLIYNAPEVLDETGESAVTAKAEIFSLGLVIWEMVALAPPHCDGLEDSLNSNIDDSVLVLDNSQASLFSEGTLGSRPEFPDSVGPEYKTVKEIFTACTEKNPDDRPSAAELIKMIDALN